MSYLADVQMPQKEEIVEEREQEYVESDEEEQAEEEVLPETVLPVKKEKIMMDDIFKAKAPPPKKELQIRERPVIVPKIAPVKQKRKMSEKQLEALARGRATRAKNKKPEAPAPAPAPAPEPVAAPVAAPAPAPPAAATAQQQYYSQQDLQEMVYQGVQRYDAVRKRRKEVKKKVLARQTHEKKVFSDINNALERAVPTSDPWANCFT